MVSTNSTPQPTLILTGPTACGKTSVAIELALQSQKRGHTVEIINGDSILVYRGLNIGSAKPTPAEQQGILHHLIDIRDPHEPYTAGDFYRDACQKVKEIYARGSTPIVVGGTGFYLQALLQGMWEGTPAQPELRKSLEALDILELVKRLEAVDPERAKELHPNDRYRWVRALELFHATGKTAAELKTELLNRSNDHHLQFELWAIDREDQEVDSRIHQRTQSMLRDGLLAEVKDLMHLYPQARSLRSVGYAEAQDYLNHLLPEGRKIRPGLEGLADEIELGTRQLVKRQRTWIQGQIKRLEKSSMQRGVNLSPFQSFLLNRDRNSLFEQFHARLGP